jgi:hypothetical protein
MARSSVIPVDTRLSLTLDRYQEINLLPEAAFNGLMKPSDASCYQCGVIWSQADRDGLAMSIKSAEEMRIKELTYNLSPIYKLEEEYTWNSPLILDSKLLVKVGTEKTSTIQLAVPVVLIPFADPIVLTVPTTVTDPSEIVVYYANEDVRINPKSVVISGGNAIITIPLPRLVDPTIDLNCNTPDYVDTSIYVTSVDVKRVYYDESDAIQLLWYGDCGCGGGCSTTETIQYAFAKVKSDRHRRLSIVNICPGTYNGSSWIATSWQTCRAPDKIKINYVSGRKASMQTEVETVRLAHTLLPRYTPTRPNPCSGCWKADQEPDPSELITPYGMYRGSVFVWMSDSRSKIGMGGKF